VHYRFSRIERAAATLHERGGDDIMIFANHFLDVYNLSERKKIRGIGDSAAYLLCNYNFNENIRELKGCIFRAVVLCNTDFIQPEHLPDLLSLSVKKQFFNDPIFVFDRKGRCKTMDEIEKEIIERLLGCFDDNISEVSKMLDIARSTLYKKLPKTPKV
jgi:DNA-binding NtrC family response regulator